MNIEKVIISKYKGVVWIKALVLLICSWLIYQKLSDPERFGEQFLDVVKNIDSKAIFILVVVVFLMPFNWLLEAFKWRILARPHNEISIKEAYQGILSGLSLGFMTPHGIGDYAGRLLSLEGKSRSKLIGGVWLGRVMQMLITSLFGLVGVFMFIKMSGENKLYINTWWWVVFLLGVLIVVLLFRSKVRVFGERINYYFASLKDYVTRDYLLLFVYSTGRYAIFSTQYLLILYIFEIPLPVFTLFGGISWMFFMKSIIPSFNFLSDLGVRELSVLTFFDLYQVSQPAVLTSSLLLWVINILFPVLIGLYFVFKLKLISK